MSGTCYRHPDRPAGVVCQRCDRPICPSCMTQASVGFHCPECLKKHGQKVVNTRNLGAQPIVTMGLIAVNLLVFAITRQGGLDIARSALGDYGLNGQTIDRFDEWYRIITSGFLHADLLHVGFNMYLLYMLGQQLEKVLGNIDFGLLYLAGLMGGSMMALVAAPNSFTVGASGAVFGLMGGWLMFTRSRGISFMNSGIGGLLLINLVLSFRPGVSWGGHAGGLIAGIVVGWILTDGRKAIPNAWARRGISAAFCALAFAGSLWAAGTWTSPLF